MFAEVDAERGRETQLAIAGEGGRAVAVVVDVREAGVADAIVTTARDEFGRIDVLVNNVGHFGGAAQGVPRADRRRVGRPLPCQLRTRARVLPRGPPSAHRPRRWRQHRERLDHRGVPAIPTRGLLGLQVGDHGSHTQPRRRVRHPPDSCQRVAPDVTETLQVPIRLGQCRRRAPDPGMGAVRPVRDRRRHGRRCAVPRCRISPASSRARRCTPTVARSRPVDGSPPKKAAGPTAPADRDLPRAPSR